MAKIENRPKEKMQLTIEYEYKAIGRKVYEWLTEVAVAEHSDYWIATGAELDIVATLTGRKI